MTKANAMDSTATIHIMEPIGAVTIIHYATMMAHAIVNASGLNLTI